MKINLLLNEILTELAKTSVFCELILKVVNTRKDDYQFQKMILFSLGTLVDKENSRLNIQKYSLMLQNINKLKEKNTENNDSELDKIISQI